MPIYHVLKCDHCDTEHRVPYGGAWPAAWLRTEQVITCGWPCLRKLAEVVERELAQERESVPR